MEPFMTNIQLMRNSQAFQHMGISRSTFYSQIKTGLLPQPIRLGPNSVAWLKHELDAVLSARICGYDDGALQELVTNLISERQNY